MSGFGRLALAAAALAFAVIVAGAWVRLSDAGLGCPDWPGCYGRATPAHASDAIARAVAAQGGEHGPVSLAKAWTEMGHRYLAGTLGLVIAALAALAWRLGRWRGLATGLAALVAFQATLGMWTVTLLLKPAIVTAHLLGGMATLGALVWLALGEARLAPAPEARAWRLRAAAGLALAAVQIALGGWVSANYAALACPDLPLCLGEAVPPMDFASAFHVLRELGQTAAGELLPREALTAIHWLHRVFALVVLAGLVALAAGAARVRALRAAAIAVGALVAAQFALGVANVATGLPLALAAAHNALAAALLAALVVLNFLCFHGMTLRRA